MLNSKVKPQNEMYETDNVCHQRLVVGFLPIIPCFVRISMAAISFLNDTFYIYGSQRTSNILTKSFGRVSIRYGGGGMLFTPPKGKRLFAPPI